MQQKTRRFDLKERSWILYDWANSVYATNMMAAIFPTIFVSMAGSSGDRWWSLGTALATLLVAVLSPFLGAIADYKGMKKKLFTGFMLLGVATTASLAFMSDWRMMLVGYVISHIGFSGANLFYDSFLTDVTPNERMDKVSSWGYAMGYIGGSTIPFVLSIAMLLWLGYESPVAQKFSILITSLWWLLFTIPFLKNVHQVHYIDKPDKLRVGTTIRDVLTTGREIVENKGMLLFMLAYFFYIDGVGTIIKISTAYGTALGLGAVGMILALLVTQIVAMPCSILFGKLAQKITTRRAILMAIAIYMVICAVGFVMGYTLEPHQEAFGAPYRQLESQAAQDLAALGEEGEVNKAVAAYFAASRTEMIEQAAYTGDPELAFHLPGLTETEAAEAQAQLDGMLTAFAQEQEPVRANLRRAIGRSTIMFWSMAILVGTVQGGIQAVSRSYFGKLVPKRRSNEFFGFFDIFGKFASFIGPLLYALIGSMTGRSSWGTLALLVLFLMGFIILWRGKEPLRELEEQRAAMES